ncbi:MAG: hypothetical protein LWY06_11980 [Firmicutes bacterium]|nr:hypothetical protein [Bacillota bacterium]
MAIIKISSDIVKNDMLPTNCMTCVDKKDTKVYPSPVFNYFMVSIIFLIVTVALLAFRMVEQLIYAAIVYLLIMNVAVLLRQVVNMRFCDKCYKDYEFHKKVIRLINFAVIIATFVTAKYFLKTTDWTTAIIIVMLAIVIIPGIYGRIVKKYPINLDMKKDYSLWFFPDEKYQQILDGIKLKTKK